MKLNNNRGEAVLVLMFVMFGVVSMFEAAKELNKEPQQQEQNATR